MGCHYFWKPPHVLLQKYVPSGFFDRMNISLMPWSRNVWCLWPSTTTGASLQFYLKLHKAFPSTGHFTASDGTYDELKLEANWTCIWNTTCLVWSSFRWRQKSGIFYFFHVWPWPAKTTAELSHKMLQFESQFCLYLNRAQQTMTQQEVCQDYALYGNPYMNLPKDHIKIVWWIFLWNLASLDALENVKHTCISPWNMAENSPGSLVWLSELPTFLSSSMGHNSPENPMVARGNKKKL